MPLAYKIKSSNNSNYSVNVVYGVLGVCEKAELVITRIKGPPKADHLTIQFVNVPAETKADAVKDLFASGPPKGEITGETAVKLSAAE